MFGVSRPKSRGSKFPVKPAALERATAIDSERVWYDGCVGCVNMQENKPQNESFWSYSEPMVKVAWDARKQRSFTSDYWQIAFLYLRVRKNAQEPVA